MRIDAIKLKLLAAESDMKVKELADASGVRTIVKLAKALHVDAIELIDQS